MCNALQLPVGPLQAYSLDEVTGGSTPECNFMRGSLLERCWQSELQQIRPRPGLRIEHLHRYECLPVCHCTCSGPLTGSDCTCMFNDGRHTGDSTDCSRMSCCSAYPAQKSLTTQVRRTWLTETVTCSECSASSASAWCIVPRGMYSRSCVWAGRRTDGCEEFAGHCEQPPARFAGLSPPKAGPSAMKVDALAAQREAIHDAASHPWLQLDLQHWLSQVGIGVVRAAVSPEHQLRTQRRVQAPPTAALIAVKDARFNCWHVRIVSRIAPHRMR